MTRLSLWGKVAFVILFGAAPALADIYQWEYINPADPGQGKRRSTTLAPDGAGVEAGPGTYFDGLNLTMAYLTEADLHGTSFIESTLTNADFSKAHLVGTRFGTVDLTGASFHEAKLANAAFGYCRGDAICSQLFATLTDADFRDADLNNASFYGATLTNANFTGSRVQGVSFGRQGDCALCVFGTGIAPTQLYSTASYHAHDLSGIGLGGNDLSGANFVDQNLAHASFLGARLTNVNFTRAEIRGAEFGKIYLPVISCGISCGISIPVGTDLTLEQLYSTASYRDHDLSGIRLSYQNLADANLAGQNLNNAVLDAATLTGANLSAADMRGAYASAPADVNTTNLIRPNGHIEGLDLGADDLLVVRDDDGGLTYYPYYHVRPPTLVTVDQHLAMSAGGTLRIVFETDAWDSTISFAPGIPVTLGGTLELTLAANVNPATQVGRTFSLFDWTGVTPTGAFAVSSDYRWDLSQLYTTGEVTFVAVPEPRGLYLPLSLLAAVFATCPIRLRQAKQAAASLFFMLILASFAHADIFQWEYINPADPSQGKQQSATLAPDGAGVDAAPGAFLSYHNLTTAYLNGADLTNAFGFSVNLTNASLSQANLAGAFLYYSNLTDADLNHAKIARAFLEHSNFIHADFNHANLAGSTLSFTNLTNANLSHATLTMASAFGATLTGANLNQAVLTGGDFESAVLTDADLTGAEVRGARFDRALREFVNEQLFFSGTGVTLTQLYSTLSYKSHDLAGIGLQLHDLSGGDFAGQNLTGASFRHATLTDADFTDAVVRGAAFDRSDNYEGRRIPTGSGITLPQLYATASYRNHELGGIGLDENNLAGGNFAGQDLTAARLWLAKLTGADFGKANLTNAYLSGAVLTDAKFRKTNLTNANFAGATLTDADFTDAEVRGANFSGFGGLGLGITLGQLYATSSYQIRDLSGVDFTINDLSGGNFAAQNLTSAKFGKANLIGANFRHANLANVDFRYFIGYFRFPSYVPCNAPGFDTSCIPVYDITLLTNSDLTGADARGALSLVLSDATYNNLIQPDGHISGLELETDGLLIVRDYDGDPGSYEHPFTPPIVIKIDQFLAMSSGGTLQMVFDADDWDSTISFAPGIPVALGGTLELTFANDVNLASQRGRTFRLFDWTGVTPTGAFAIASDYRWDLANLYSTGEVTLTAIPEPSSFQVIGLALGALITRRRTRTNRASTGDTVRR